jgi:hypothetical protein
MHEIKRAQPGAQLSTEEPHLTMTICISDAITSTDGTATDAAKGGNTS